MPNARGHRTWWWAAAGVAALVAIVAIVVGISGSPATVDPSAEMAAGETAQGEASSAPDAATSGEDPEAHAAAQEGEEMQFVPNEVLVSVEDPAVLETLVPGAELAGGTIVTVESVSEGERGSVVKITFEGDASEDDVVDALGAMDGVTAQKNFVYHLM